MDLLEKAKCSVEGCGREVNARGWCRAHYNRWRRHGDPLAGAKLRNRTPKQPCKVEGCGRSLVAHGMCRLHYNRYRRYGDPHKVQKRRPAKGCQCSVDGCSREVIARGLCPMHYGRLQRLGMVFGSDALPRRKYGPTCSIEGCGRKHFATGLCGPHYKLKNKSRGPGRRCSFPGCDRRHEAKGYCGKHYERLMRNGDPAFAKLQRCQIGEKRINGNGYVIVKVGKDHPQAKANGWALEHRVVMSEILGRRLLPTEQVHHKNGNIRDNSPENLEIWNVSHPAGQRPEDKVNWAKRILALYGEMADAR